MLRSLVWTLRQRRYAALAAFMAVLAVACVSIGTFEIHRLQEKRHDNSTLRSNTHAAAVPLSTSLVPLVGSGSGPSALAIRYRTVTVTGTFLADRELYVGNRTQDGDQGFWVLTPLRSSAGTLLVVRGFVASTADGARPADVPAPPTGAVRVSARLQTGSSSSDELGTLGRGEITTINPAQQAARLGTPTFDAYATLAQGSVGNDDLDAVPGPDLSNPTGGAGELQLLSYVVQWYVFALLALCAPFLFSRAEVREARMRFLGENPDAVQFDLAADARAALTGATSPDGAHGAVAVRERGELARASDGVDVRLQRAERLADRYGRSLGTGPRRRGREDAPDDAPVVADAGDAGDRAPGRRIGGVPGSLREATASNSSTTPHRSTDEYHGSYNDYLWQLALADGAVPDSAPEGPEAPDAPGIERPAPHVIDAPTDEQ